MKSMSGDSLHLHFFLLLMNLFNCSFASFTLVEAYYIAGKPSPDSKPRVRVDIQLVNSVNNQTVFVENVLVDDGYTETLCIHRDIAKQLGLKGAGRRMT